MNNRNVESEWYCTDVEWRRPADAEHLDFNARFDIIAITKKSPYRIAIIELKYGRKAVGGDSGIRKHIEVFYLFGKYNYFEIFKSSSSCSLADFSEAICVPSLLLMFVSASARANTFEMNKK